MDRLIIICEPLSSGASVQFDLMKLVIKALKDTFDITLVSPHIPQDKIEKFSKILGLKTVSLSDRNSHLNRIYRFVDKNEAALWGFSWLMESLFRANSSVFNNWRGEIGDEKIVNISYTLPARSLLYWNQATPPLITLKMMSFNLLAQIVSGLFGPFINFVDGNLRKRHKVLSEKVIHNSNYLKDLYISRDLESEFVIHTPKEFTNYEYKEEKRTRDYVLAYIGKEVEIKPLLRLAEAGVKIVSFGSKIPYGIPLRKIKENLGFLGYVDDEGLTGLYNNALFTAFPFTEEPFGWVPLESMYQGTPVLSYNKQGPAETIINDVTGWLVSDEYEFVQKALELWNSRDVGVSPLDCVNRSLSFSLEKMREKLLSLIFSP